MVRFTIDSDSGQFILFDEVEKLKVIITIEAVQAFGNKYTLDEDGIKKFYNEYRNRRIAITRKSANKNAHGYFETQITIQDFLHRGLLENQMDSYSRIPWNAVHYYENEERNGKDIPSFDDNKIKLLFDKAIILHEQFTNNNQYYTNLGNKDKSHAIAHYLKENALPSWLETLGKDKL